MSRVARLSWLLRSSFAHVRRSPGCADLARMAVAAYDPVSDVVSARCHAGQGHEVLDSHEFVLAEMPGLSLLASGRQPRVIHDLPQGRAAAPHMLAMRAAGLRSSLTVPLLECDELRGFLFLNARVSHFFNEARLRRLEPFMVTLPGLILREMIREFEGLTLASSRV